MRDLHRSKEKKGVVDRRKWRGDPGPKGVSRKEVQGVEETTSEYSLCHRWRVRPRVLPSATLSRVTGLTKDEGVEGAGWRVQGGVPKEAKPGTGCSSWWKQDLSVWTIGDEMSRRPEAGPTGVCSRGREERRESGRRKEIGVSGPVPCVSGLGTEFPFVFLYGPRGTDTGRGSMVPSWESWE